MTSAHTAGELAMGTYRAEASPGVIQTGALSYIGLMQSLKNDSDDQGNFVNGPGSRGFSLFERGPYKKGFTIKYHAPAHGAWGDWLDFFGTYVLGSKTAPTDHLGYFSYINYVTSRSKYEIYTGCKANKGTLTFLDYGRFIEIEVQCFALAHLIKSSKTLTDYQAVTIGADPTAPTEAKLFWNTGHQINVAGGGLGAFWPKRATLSIDNKLEREPGIKTWADATKYPTSLEHHEDDREIVYDCELIMKDDTWDGRKEAASLITALTIPIDDDTITLANGYIVPNNFSELEQKLGNDKVQIRFPTLSIA